MGRRARWVRSVVLYLFNLRGTAWPLARGPVRRSGIARQRHRQSDLAKPCAALCPRGAAPLRVVGARLECPIDRFLSVAGGGAEGWLDQLPRRRRGTPEAGGNSMSPWPAPPQPSPQGGGCRLAL